MRVPLDDLNVLTGQMAIELRLRTIVFDVPASGPEIGLLFDGWDSERPLVAALERHGLEVLATRVVR